MKKITIVEDDPDMQFILRSVLIRAGYEIRILPDGRDLFANEPFPDLFILDIELPFITGLELCQQLKNGMLTRNIPVLMVSASFNLLALAKDVHADDSLEKPFDISVLLDKVNTLTGNSSEPQALSLQH